MRWGCCPPHRILCWPFLSSFSTLKKSFIYPQVSLVSGQKSSFIFIFLSVHNVGSLSHCPHDYICSLPLIFSTMTRDVWSLPHLLDLCRCFSLILDISCPLSLQIFLLFHTLSPLFSFWDSSHTYIWWFDIILQISDNLPHILFSYCSQFG